MFAAVSTSDGKAVDLHFGHTTRFSIYRANGGSIKLVDKRDTIALSTGDKDHGFDRESFEKIWSVLKDCNRIYCCRIGARPKAELEKKGIAVIEYSGSIKDISL